MPTASTTKSKSKGKSAVRGSEPRNATAPAARSQCQRRRWFALVLPQGVACACTRIIADAHADRRTAHMQLDRQSVGVVGQTEDQEPYMGYTWLNPPSSSCVPRLQHVHMCHMPRTYACTQSNHGGL